MMLYQRIIIKVFGLLMISLLIGILGVLLGGGDFAEADEVLKRKVKIYEVPKVLIEIEPKDTKPKSDMVKRYNTCNEGCVNLLVKQSCSISGYGVHYTDVEVCTREGTHKGTKFKCDKYTDRCFPFKCDQEGKACLIKCYKDADCQSPNRCIKKGSNYYHGICRVPTWTCVSSPGKHHLMSNGFETVNCSPYACVSEPKVRCMGSCGGMGDCDLAAGFLCNADGRCVQ